MKLEDHPTVRKFHDRPRPPAAPPAPLDAEWLKALARACGADDAGLVELDRPALADQREEIRGLLPGARTLLSLVVRMNREPIRTPARSLSNLEFHHVGDETNEAARRIVEALEERGIRALNPAMGFPMEIDRFPGRIWTVSHKPVAVAAGLGMMGIHRNVIHPRFGNFILLATVVIAAEATAYDQSIDYNPCLECKLCVAACPVGAIAPDGHFDFSACYTHNYREFMGGFTDWAETVADSRDGLDYRRRVGDAESASMWQSLSFGANYKAAYCLSVCPAGEDVIAPYLENRREHLETIVRPLQQKVESIYVVPGSDAEDHVRKRFPHKTVRNVRGSLRPRSIDGLLSAMPHAFQREKAAGLNAVYHFRFTGEEPREVTIRIADRTLAIEPGLVGRCDVRVTVDSRTWLKFIAKEISLFRALVTFRLRIRGNPLFLARFGRCFPS